MRRTRFESNMDKRSNLARMESEGKVADNIDVRISIMKKVESGEITLEDAQSQIKQIKRDAKKNGLLTRSQAFNAG
jgi:hypothetical protein